MSSSANDLDRLLTVVPYRFRDRTLETYKPTTPSQHRALLEARRLVAGEIRSLVLIGPAGVGKTHLAAGALRGHQQREQIAIDAEEVEFRRDWNADLDGREPWRRFTRRRDLRVGPAWQNVAELVSGLRMDMDRDRDERGWGERLEEALAPASLLVLDDLGREKISDWTGELVYSLINGRYEREQSTIATSNMSPAELQASGYWTSISRLAEDGALVEITAPDYRLRK